MSQSTPSAAEIINLTTNQVAAFERRLRRTAQHQGLRVVKSRRRTTRKYRLHHVHLNRVVWIDDIPNRGCWMTLGELAQWLQPEDRTIPKNSR